MCWDLMLGSPLMSGFHFLYHACTQEAKKYCTSSWIFISICTGLGRLTLGSTKKKKQHPCLPQMIWVLDVFLSSTQTTEYAARQGCWGCICIHIALNLTPHPQHLRRFCCIHGSLHLVMFMCSVLSQVTHCFCCKELEQSLRIPFSVYSQCRASSQ